VLHGEFGGSKAQGGHDPERGREGAEWGEKGKGGGGVRKREGEDVLHARGTATRTREGGAETDDAETRGHWNETILNKYPGEADDKRDEQNQHEKLKVPRNRASG
jgi:hypothetical protein